MNVKKWNFSYSKREKTEGKQNIMDGISLWVAMGLLWFSFISIIQEHFPAFCETITMDWWTIVFFMVLLFLGFEWPKKYLKRLAVPVRVIGVGMPIAYIVANLEKVIDGMKYILDVYLPHVNSYYKTRFSIGQTGEQENAVVAFAAICMVCWTLVWLLAYGLKKRVLLVLFPVIALGLELAVGLSPLGNGLFYILFAGLLIMSLGGYSVVRKAVVLAGVWISVAFASLCFSEDIEKLSSIDAKQSLLRWQNNVKLDDFNIFKNLQIDFHFNWENLSNDSPQYTGKIVLEVEMDRNPQNTVYLKGFYGTNYEDGNWSYDASAFEKACKEAGKSPEEVAEQIFQMPYERLYALESASAEYFPEYLVSMIARYIISYVGTTGDVAYAPYISDYTSMDEEYTFMGDYLLKKSLFDKTVAVSGINLQRSVSTWEEVINNIAVGTFDYPNMSSEYSSYYYIGLDLTAQLDELEWMNSLADAYLQVPEDADFISAEVEKAKENLKYYEYKTSGVVGMEDENYARLVYAVLVRDYLAERMSYSLKLDNLPMGTDPIEYALTKSHEGYCMHFASAATLMLRELGVPARYVSGYSVAQSAFSKDTEANIYKAEVGDYMAHAWVEIYLDYIGWIPFEVTPGSSLEMLPTTEDINRWESQSNAHRQEIVDREDETESEEITETEDVLVETEDSETEDSEETSQSQQQTPNRPQDNQNTIGGRIDWEEIGKSLGMFALIIFIGFVLVFLGKQGISHYERVLDKEVEKNMSRRVVKRINRRLYYMLRLSRINSWFKVRWTDAEYRNALVERFPNVTEAEWDKYMDIVKKNHYSKEMISTDEMMYCYNCYKRKG